MKFSIYSVVLLSCALLANSASAQTNTPYTFNRAPLKQNVYAQLPIGSIKAKGWLLKQLELQKTGMTGHAEELYPGKNDLGKDSDWLGGSGNGWEKVPYYVKGLVALAYTLDDAELKAKAQKWLDYTLDHPEADGKFGPTKMKDWWPRMPFMYALQSYHEATQDKRVIPLLSNYFKYQLANLDKEPLFEWGKARAADNIEIVLWVYNKTGDKDLLTLATKLKQQAYPWDKIFNQNEFLYYGDDHMPKHMVNVSQALKFPIVYSQVEPTPAFSQGMQRGIEHILNNAGQPTGIGSGTEFMSGTSALQGVETCAVVEWMQSLESAARVDHSVSIGDQLEKIAFNTLPAQYSRDLHNHAYYTLPNQVQSTPGNHGFNQDYGNGIVLSPYSGFPCCRYNMHMGWPYFVKNAWLATPDGGLAVSIYAPMEINAVVANGSKVKIDEVTNYPFNEQIALNLSLDKSAKFPLNLRIPAWCKKPQVKVNGVAVAAVKAGDVLALNRQWKTNDKITLNFPMNVAVTKQVNNGVSVERGPLVYALKIKENVKVSRTYQVSDFKETELSPATPWNYGLVLTGPAANNFTVVKAAMPENPFEQDVTPIMLKAKAKQIPGWGIDHKGSAAFEAPYSPTPSTERTEEVTLVPYGSENLRLSVFPTIGQTNWANKTFKQTFDNNAIKDLVIYGGGWFAKDNALHCASNGGNSSGGNGPKMIATGTNFADLEYSADITINSPGDAGLVFRVTKPSIGADAYLGYYVGLNPTKGTIEFGKADGKKWTVIASEKFAVKLNDTHKLKVKAKGNKFEFYVGDGATPLLTASDDEYKSGNVGFRAYGAIATMDNMDAKAL
ncbi:beta-L-arabinofuranosidase domain-containing protein [Mucilaginibacter myungsuensis]|nr:beta-L-arabinofuranosidase domain-containing protein [Mucilaginibacter myungsuensis]MDN3600551.1 glycoside hydrolase family 127 protein [Mucilaginibacter myungsuensis]